MLVIEKGHYLFPTNDADMKEYIGIMQKTPDNLLQSICILGYCDNCGFLAECDRAFHDADDVYNNRILTRSWACSMCRYEVRDRSCTGVGDRSCIDFPTMCMDREDRDWDCTSCKERGIACV